MINSHLTQVDDGASEVLEASQRGFEMAKASVLELHRSKTSTTTAKMLSALFLSSSQFHLFPYRSCISSGPIAGSYSPPGTGAPRLSLAMGLVSLQTDRRRTSSSPKNANETPATLVEVTSGEGAAIAFG